MIKIPKPHHETVVMIIGHKDAHFMLDTGDSVQHFNKTKVVYVVDNHTETGDHIEKKCGNVFVTPQQNGWGRGILRSIVQGLDFFSDYFTFDHLITMDSDSLCVGPFVDRMVERIGHNAFVGTIWRSPDPDHHFHKELHASGFLRKHRPFRFQTDIAAGPCMLWSKMCLEFMTECGLRPAVEFDKIYPNIGFAHDQISTYFLSTGVGGIGDAGDMMSLRWREAVPCEFIPKWGQIPIVEPGVAIIHPTVSEMYEEETVRNYFRRKRYMI